MTINLYNFTKRPNSTKRPDDPVLWPETSLDGEIKGQVDIMAPVVKFLFSVQTEAPNYNYAYIPEFRRYYFIESWEFNSGFWIAVMSIDVLATYRNDIGGVPSYITRTSTTFDGDVVDTMYPAKGGKKTIMNTYTSPFYYRYDTGTYIVGIVSGNVVTVGAVAYYAFNNANFKKFLKILLTTLSWADDLGSTVEQLGESVVKSFINPMQYIVSCLWFPYEITGSVSMDTILIGPGTIYGSGDDYYQCYPLGYDNSYDERTYYYDIPKHPQASVRGNYLNKSPYSNYVLEFYPWGTIALDSDKIFSTTKLKVGVITDHVTGVGTMRIMDAANDNFIEFTQAQVGVPIQLAQMSINWGNLVHDAASLGKGIIGGVSDIGTFFESVGYKPKH